MPGKYKTPRGKAATNAKRRYYEKNYDRINLTVPKGQKEALKAHADQCGESVNSFINRAIIEAIERDNNKSD